jgi:predicted membrane protein
MTITYRIGFRDRLAFAAYHLTRNPLILLMSAAMFLMVTFLNVVPVMRESSANTPLLLRVFVFVFIESLLFAIILVFWTVMTVITMISRKNKPLYCQRILTVGDEGIITESEYGRSEIKWSLVQKLARTRKHIIMYLNQQSAIIIPHRAFESVTQCDTFYEICRRSKKNVV